MLDAGEYKTTPKEYIHFIKNHEPNYYALRDYPITKDIFNRTGETIKDLQEKTLEAHLKILNLHRKNDISATPVAVIHGKKTKEYLQMIRKMNQWEILNRMDYLGIGGLKPYSTNTLKHLLKKVRRNVPTHIKLHGFGIGVSQVKEGELYNILESADSQDYSLRGRYLDEHKNGEINRFTAVSNSYTSKKIKMMKTLRNNPSNNHTQPSLIDSLNRNEKTRAEKINELMKSLAELKQNLKEKDIYEREQHLFCKECLHSDNRPNNLLHCPIFDHQCAYKNL